MSPALAAQGVEQVKDAVGAIDTHTHFYNPERKQGVPWPNPADKLLYRPVFPAEFVKLAAPHGVTGTVVVEASPWPDDNQWLLDLAKDEPAIVGVIGNLAPGTTEFAGLWKRYAGHELFRGIRVNKDKLAAGLENPAYVDDLKRIAADDRTLDVNGGPDTPAIVARLAEKLPNLRIVINHCGNVKIDGLAPPAAWLDGMKQAAACERVWCKVSALVEGTGKRDGDAPAEVGFYRPVLDALWNAFGPKRLVYGSNWPVSARFASYATVFSLVDRYFREKGPAANQQYFRENSLAAYQWKNRQK